MSEQIGVYSKGKFIGSVKPREQIVIGKLQTPYVIKAAADSPSKSVDPIKSWDHRAMWSYLRLQHGRKIDAEIKQYFKVISAAAGHNLTKPERKRYMTRLFEDFVEKQKNPRRVQFIKIQGRVMAVASLKHLLIPPAEVYDMAQKLLAVNYGRPEQVKIDELDGLTYQTKQVAGLNLGLQLHGGTITTRQAITVTCFLHVQLCANPLSWLGVGGFSGRFGIEGSGYEKILRIKVRHELEPRLRQAITYALGQVDVIEEKAKAAEKVSLKDEEARIIAAAMGLGYDVGKSTVKQVLKQYEKEPKNLWGLSMAYSWVASHGKFRKTPDRMTRHVEQKLSTIAGVTLLLTDKQQAKERSLAWLKSHVKTGRISKIEDLIGGGLI